MYIQALLGPAILGLHFEFLHVTSATYSFPLTLVDNLKSPVMLFLPYNLLMSHIWFGGIGAGGGAFGAGEAYPVLVHSVRAQFCPIPQAPFPLAKWG